MLYWYLHKNEDCCLHNFIDTYVGITKTSLFKRSLPIFILIFHLSIWYTEI